MKAYVVSRAQPSDLVLQNSGASDAPPAAMKRRRGKAGRAPKQGGLVRDGPSNANAAVAVGDGESEDPFDRWLGGDMDLGSIEVDPAGTAEFFGSIDVDPADTADFLQSLDV